MSLILMGICVFFNFVVIIRKFRKARYADASLDTALFVIVMFMFSGSYNALVVGTIASALVSVYLFFNPVYILKRK